MTTTPNVADSDVIELEPTVMLEAVGGPAGAAPISPGPAVRLAPAGATFASFAGKTESLRRTRLFGAAVCLAVLYTLLVAWTFLGNAPGTLCTKGTDFSFRLGMLGLHGLIAAAVAGFLAGEADLTNRQLRAAEYALFLGLTLVSMVSLYVVGLDLVRRGPDQAPAILVFVKDGLIQMLVLMMIFGMLIPNTPAAAARMLLFMFLGPAAVGVALRMHPEAAPVLEQLGEVEEAGSNTVFLGIGTAVAMYGAFLVNGLRIQLREALKFGQYKLIRSLGAGGMGEVYLAEHALLKRPCALKLIRPDAGADPVALARFEREVQSSARLAHHNTIEIYDYGHTEDGTFYYVMEYLKGLNLGDLVRRAGPLPAGRVIYIFRQVCAGLAEAHGLGLVHRDLKPANVFVAVLGGEADVAKVLDFGLVKVSKEPEATALTAEMTVSGTPHYMAPEQAAASRDLDARADVYALGAMLYYVLTGRPPFDGENAIAVMMAHARDSVVRPSEIQPGIPADLEAVTLRALAKTPADRFANVRDLSDALAACASAADWGPRQAEEWWASSGAIDPA